VNGYSIDKFKEGTKYINIPIQTKMSAEAVKEISSKSGASSMAITIVSFVV
jgi:hypothetical protein